jgi:hypothetical protein
MLLKLVDLARFASIKGEAVVGEEEVIALFVGCG